MWVHIFLLRQNGEMRKEQSISLKEMAEANKEQVIIMERISSTLTHLENRIDKMEGDIKQLKRKGKGN